jgi:hypothetical protein
MRIGVVEKFKGCKGVLSIQNFTVSLNNITDKCENIQMVEDSEKQQDQRK